MCATDFAINVLGMSAEEAEKEVRGFSANYGTALAGFVVRRIGCLLDGNVQ